MISIALVLALLAAVSGVIGIVILNVYMMLISVVLALCGKVAMTIGIRNKGNKNVY